MAWTQESTSGLFDDSGLPLKESHTSMARFTNLATVCLRIALGAAFLSAVADRFGYWGASGQRNVAWGDFGHFTAYTAKLNWFLPGALAPTLAWAATVAEITLGIALILGIYTRIASSLSAALLILFAVEMSLASSIKAPLDASVFSASAGAFLLACQASYPVSLDQWIKTRRARQAKERILNGGPRDLPQPGIPTERN